MNHSCVILDYFFQFFSSNVYPSIGLQSTDSSIRWCRSFWSIHPTGIIHRHTRYPFVIHRSCILLPLSFTSPPHWVVWDNTSRTLDITAPVGRVDRPFSIDSFCPLDQEGYRSLCLWYLLASSCSLTAFFSVRSVCSQIPFAWCAPQSASPERIIISALYSNLLLNNRLLDSCSCHS